MQMGVSLLLSRATYCELLFHLRKYRTISKRLSLLLRMNIFLNITGLCQKLWFGRHWEPLQVWAHLAGGSTLTQQLIKQQVVGDAPDFARKATEIVDALALERSMSKDEILTAYLKCLLPLVEIIKGRILQVPSKLLKGFSAIDANKLSDSPSCLP